MPIHLHTHEYVLWTLLRAKLRRDPRFSELDPFVASLREAYPGKVSPRAPEWVLRDGEVQLNPFLAWAKARVEDELRAEGVADSEMSRLTYGQVDTLVGTFAERIGGRFNHVRLLNPREEGDFWALDVEMPGGKGYQAIPETHHIGKLRIHAVTRDWAVLWRSGERVSGEGSFGPFWRVDMVAEIKRYMEDREKIVAMAELFTDYCAGCGAEHVYMSGPCGSCGGRVFSRTPPSERGES